MNVKSFPNEAGIAVNVDLDLVTVVGELRGGKTVLRFGGQEVVLSVPYAEMESKVTASGARRIPLPPPKPKKKPEPPLGGDSDDSANDDGAEGDGEGAAIP